MKRALIVATLPSFITCFEMNDIRLLQDMGYQVHAAANYNDDFNNSAGKLEQAGVVRNHIDIERNPFQVSNAEAVRQLVKILNKYHFDCVHCHTPVGGVAARLAAKKSRKKGTKVIYTAHGFHFYQGAPWRNWIIYYPIEKFLSRWTDILITINQEDYKMAKYRFHSKRVEYIPGVGVNIGKFQNKEVCSGSVRKELGILEDDIFLLSVGELSKRKNHEIVIKIIEQINNPKIKYFICGRGELYGELKNLIERLNMQKNIRLLGFRTDICELCKTADLFVFPSLQEGLPVALMEAIACGAFVVCSKIRGNIDLVEEESCLFNPLNYNNAFEIISSNIKRIMDKECSDVIESITTCNYRKVEKCDESVIKKYMADIYSGC